MNQVSQNPHSAGMIRLSNGERVALVSAAPGSLVQGASHAGAGTDGHGHAGPGPGAAALTTFSALVRGKASTAQSCDLSDTISLPPCR